jgi:endonuclease/exonuclease/phosphatase family metal-dependent hydrolase
MKTTLFSHWSLASRLALLGLCGLGLAGCQSAPSRDAAFRVMTYNIHHGEGLDGQVELERIAELVKREHADLVALQEVDKGVERTARRDFPAELAALTGLTCVFSNNYHYQGGDYGNAVLTRFPVKRWTNTHFSMLHPGEQRGILQLVLEVHGRELVFMDTHLDSRSAAERLQSALEIQQLTEAYRDRPIILCGDFNDPPGSRTHQKIAEQFADAWPLAGAGDGFTIPAERPAKRIDYIWLSLRNALVPSELHVPSATASDHLPVVGEFRFR